MFHQLFLVNLQFKLKNLFKNVTKNIYFVAFFVYNKEGKRIKEYKATKQYHTSGVHFPMVFLVADKMRLWYCDRMAATFALTQCVNDFVRDYNNGLFKQPVR